MRPRPAFLHLLTMTQTPVPYTPPDFAKALTPHAPAHRLHLAMRPTPIEPWALHPAVPGLPPGVSVHIKRDDQTGGPTSGNKIRKLEFLLADALARRATAIITAGGVQSNHARATVSAARRLGLNAHVFLRNRAADAPEKLGADGNLLFHRMLGVDMHLVKPMPYATGLLPRMNALKERLEAEGERPYLICIGGSDPVGLFGYIECFAEMVQQGVPERFTDVVVPVGSGGTASGLAIGNYLAGSRVRMHAVTVCDDADYFYAHLDEMLAAVGLGRETSAREILHIVEAKGRGYAVSTDAELELGLRVARETGVLLDPVYTLKGLHGMVNELRRSDGAFDENARILFVHTGGIFGLFDRRIEPFLDQSLAKTWTDQ